MLWFAYICFWISDWVFGTWGDFVCMCVRPLPFGPAFFAGLCCCVTYGWDRSVRADELGGDSHMLAAWASKGSVLLYVVGPLSESTTKREVESEKASSLSTFIREHRRSVQQSLDPRPLIRFLTARFTRAFISRGVTNSMWQAVCATHLNARSHMLHGNCSGIRSSLPPRNILMALGQAVNYDRLSHKNYTDLHSECRSDPLMLLLTCQASQWDRKQKVRLTVVMCCLLLRDSTCSGAS